MTAARKKTSDQDGFFWKTKTLEEMSAAEWESLCDGCARCCLEKLEEQEGGAPRPTSKVESGSPRGKGGGGSQSYDSLPADAKAACKEFAADLVGEGKVYKTLKEFQTYYAKTYYESN